ncbi:MAG: hypothetical protein COB69_10265, partial [Phycisphaera sp.]
MVSILNGRSVPRRRSKKMAYVPILKGKQGELKALSELAKKDKTDIMPLIEIPPVASKWNEGDV